MLNMLKAQRLSHPAGQAVSNTELGTRHFSRVIALSESDGLMNTAAASSAAVQAKSD